LKEIHPKKHTLDKAIVLMNNMINHLMETILNAIVELKKQLKKKKNSNDSTKLKCHDIQLAARLVLPNELGKITVSEANRALCKYLELEGKSNVDLKKLVLTK
jgi:hypothetical protein